MRAGFDAEHLHDESEEESTGELSHLDQHDADVASDTFEREKDFSILEQVEAELADVERALQRLDDGTYGTCEACGQPIGDERLEVDAGGALLRGPPRGRRARRETCRRARGDEAVPLLDVQDVTVRFGGVVALDGLSLRHRRGQHLRAHRAERRRQDDDLQRRQPHLPADAGRLIFDGDDLLDMPPHRIAHVGIARTFQNLAIFPSMTLLENVMVGAHSRGTVGFFRAALRLPPLAGGEGERRAFAYDLLDRLDLAPLAFRPAAGLPFGTLKRLEIARALAARPKFLLLDEPASGLTHGEVDELGDTIKHIRDEFGLTVLLVEHHMAMVMGISDHVVAMDFGRKIAEGTPEGGRRATRRSSRPTSGRRHERRRALLEVEGLRAGYGPVEVLHGIDLIVGEGEIVVVLGANGAGKTTTMRAISGTIPRRGHVVLRRATTSPRRAPTASSGAGVAQVPQGRGTFVDLSVEDNLRIGAVHAATTATSTADIERWFDVVPAPAGAPHAAGRQPLGRRAADARHLAGADEPPAAAAVRRAEPRAWRRSSSRSCSPSSAG